MCGLCRRHICIDHISFCEIDVPSSRATCPGSAQHGLRAAAAGPFLRRWNRCPASVPIWQHVRESPIWNLLGSATCSLQSVHAVVGSKFPGPAEDDGKQVTQHARNSAAPSDFLPATEGACSLLLHGQGTSNARCAVQKGGSSAAGCGCRAHGTMGSHSQAPPTGEVPAVSHDESLFESHNLVRPWTSCVLKQRTRSLKRVRAWFIFSSIGHNMK